MRTLISKRLLILIIITVLGVFLRVYRLSDYPVQLNHDEMSQLYDAISVAHTGKDIYGNFLPTIFPSVNDFKSPFYTYATTLAYFILGNHEWLIRIPGIIFGILIIPVTYLFTVKLFGNFNIALLSSFFVAISPEEIFFSRKSFENIPGIFFMILTFYLLFIYFEKQKHLRWLFLAVISMTAGMYTYFSHAIIIPLLVISFLIIFKNKFTLPLKKYIAVIIFWILLITPLLSIIFLNPDSRYRSQTVFITQDVTLGRQLSYITIENSVLYSLSRYKTIINFSFNRFLGQFSPSYLFQNGLDLTNQRILNMGPLLLSLLPFLIFGVIYMVKLPNFSCQRKFILCWVVLGVLPSGLTFEAHSPHRSIMVFIMLNIISAAGFYFVINSLKPQKILSRLLAVFVAASLIFNYLYFLHMYFVNFPFEKSQYLQYPFKQVALFAWSQYSNFDSIIFDPKFGDIEPEIGVGAQYYFAYYGNIPPATFQKEYHVGQKPREVIFDKFSIREVYWPSDKDLKNTLVIVSPWSVPEQDIADKNKIIKRFFFYNGKLAFYAIKL